MDLEKFISNLTPELQEKARKCGSVEELAALAEAEHVTLTEEAMEAIAGGKGKDTKNCRKMSCPKCGSTDLDAWPVLRHGITVEHFRCRKCGYEWEY